MSQANATSLTLSSPTENKTSESGQLKEFRTPPHNLAIEQAVLAALMTVAESLNKSVTYSKKMIFMPLVINIFIVQLKN